MKFPLRYAGAIVSLGFCALLCACGSAQTDHYYTLLGTPPVPPINDAAANWTQSVTIASVTLPESVDRSELVVRSGTNSVAVMETQRWAESLKSGIPRAIANDLSQLLGGATVSVRADNASVDARYLVYVDVTRFDSVLDDAASIDVIWSVRPAAGGQPKSGRSSLRVPVHGSGFGELVAAHAQALAALSGEIATQIRAMEAAGK